MDTSFRKLFLAPVVALALASMGMTSMDPAFGRGGAGAGAGARAGGGGAAAARPSVQPAPGRADVRTSNVRSTSVNNVNINKNINIDVDQHPGGWDHPVAGAMVVGGAIAVTAAAIGSTVAVVPVGCVPVSYGGMVYQQCGSTWYQPLGAEFVVVNPPY